MGGERIDARRHMHDWNKPGFDDSGWAAAREAAFNVELSAQMMEPTRVIETIPAQSVTRQGGAYRVDMGKNFTGWLEIRMRGLAAGDEVMIQVANREGPAEDFNQRSFFVSAGGGGGGLPPSFQLHGGAAS
jgi:alpha-L-rhamnosidase